MTDLRVTSVGFTRATRQDARTGLLGWIACVINDALLLDGIAVRRTEGGRHTLSYPLRTDRVGRRHPYVRPLGDDARQHLEREIFKALGCDLEETTP